MLKKSVLAVGAIAVVSMTFLWADGLKRQQGFTDCDLDIRPGSKKEVQVYWEGAAAAPNVMRFRLWAPGDDLVFMQFPDGTGGLPMKQGWANTVTFVYTASSPPRLQMKICNEVNPESCSTEVAEDVDIVGSYDTGGALGTPELRDARAEGNLERVFVYGWNLGLEMHFLLRRDP